MDAGEVGLMVKLAEARVTVPEQTSAAEVEQLGEEIAALAAHLHAVTYLLLVRLREFDAREGWSGGFRSCAHWLSCVSAETSRRLACDGSHAVMMHSPGGEVTAVSGVRRAVPPAVRRALEWRDRGTCRFPGCGARRCDAHHVKHWADGGATRLAGGWYRTRRSRFRPGRAQRVLRGRRRRRSRR